MLSVLPPSPLQNSRRANKHTRRLVGHELAHRDERRRLRAANASPRGRLRKYQCVGGVSCGTRVWV